MISNILNSRLSTILKFGTHAMAIVTILWLNQGIYDFIANFVPNYFRWGLYFLWFIFILILDPREIRKIITYLLPLVIFIIILAMILLYAKDGAMSQLQLIAYLFMVSSIFIYYFDTKKIKIVKIFSVIMIADYILVGINTFINLQINPMLSRYLSQGMDVQKAALGGKIYLGVGNYTYFYSLVPILLITIFLIINRGKKYLLLSVIIVPAVFMLLQASFVIAILFLVIFVLILVIFKYRSKYRFFIFIPITLLILIFLFPNGIAEFFNNLSEYYSSSREISEKMDEISYFFYGYNLSGTDLKARVDVYLKSLEAFENNILVGTLIDDYSQYGSGNHSAWLDLLARYGLLSIAFFIFMFRMYKYTKNRISNEFIGLYNTYWLYYITLGIVNTLLFASIFTTWLFFLPICLMILSEKKIINNKVGEYHEES